MSPSGPIGGGTRAVNSGGLLWQSVSAVSSVGHPLVGQLASVVVLKPGFGVNAGLPDRIWAKLGPADMAR